MLSLVEVPKLHAMAIPSVTTSLKKYKGKWGQPEVKNLLKRTLFGAKKEDIDQLISECQKGPLLAEVENVDSAEEKMQEKVPDFTIQIYPTEPGWCFWHKTRPKLS